LIFSEEIPEEDVVVEQGEYYNYPNGLYASTRSSPRGYEAVIANPQWGTAILLQNLNGVQTCLLYKSTGPIPNPAPVLRGNFVYVDDVFFNTERVSHWRMTIEPTPGQVVARVGLYADSVTGKYVSFRDIGGLGGWWDAPVFNYTAPSFDIFAKPAICVNQPVIMASEEPPVHHTHMMSLSTRLKHMEVINNHDAEKAGYSLAVNKFISMDVAHFKRGIQAPEHLMRSVVHKFSEEEHLAAPNSLDFRTGGYVTSIRNQGSCGSCWAFSTAAAVEVNMALAQNASVHQLSVQSIMDCTPLGTGIIQAKGCQGGWQPTAMQAIIDHGIAIENNYPYEGVSAPCQSNLNTLKPIQSWRQLQGEDDIKTGLSSGAVAAIFEVTTNLLFYGGGVFDDPTCGDRLDHGMTIVGYGETTSGTPYWIIKNSFGVGWGEAGYVRMIRGKNMCGIGNYAFQPIAATPSH
jgi:C1A family cysteine protease